MSEYTTGEIAKLCGVTVRTVQYYDTRGILIPSGVTEGGRRLYSEDDLRLMKIICFLRELNIPINSIGELLAEKHPETVISLILDEQERTLRGELDERQLQLEKLNELRRGLKMTAHFSVESIGDIAYIMKNKKKLRKVHAIMIAAGIIMDAIEVATAILWWKTGVWQPFAIGMVIVVALGVWISWFYFQNTAYICPQCHSVFRPAFRQAFFAPHTPSTRKLTCTACNHHGFCVETYQGRKEGK